MIFEVFGTLFTFSVLLQKPCKFWADGLKKNKLGGDSQGLQGKTKKVNIVPNTSKIIFPHGFKYDQNKTPSNGPPSLVS